MFDVSHDGLHAEKIMLSNFFMLAGVGSMVGFAEFFIRDRYNGNFHGRLLDSRGASPAFLNGDSVQMLMAQFEEEYFFPAGENDVIGLQMRRMTEKNMVETRGLAIGGDHLSRNGEILNRLLIVTLGSVHA